MKKIVLFVLLVSGSISYGKAFLYENFSDVPVNSEAKILSDSLDYKYHVEKGGRLRLKDDISGVRYSFNNAELKEMRASKLYISFLYRNLNTNNELKFGGLFLYNNGKEILGIGNDFGSNRITFWGADRQPMNICDVKRYQDNEVHKIILEIEYHDDGPEKIRVGLDPFCRRSLSRQPDQMWTEYRTELNFDELKLRCGENGSEWEFDELCISTEFSDVTIADGEPGEYIENVLNNNKPAGKSEFVDDRIVRFWPGKTANQSHYSFALNRSYENKGPMPSDCQLKPQFSEVDGKKHVYFDIDPEVDLYGTGEVTGKLLRNGYKIVLYNIDVPRYERPDQLYQSHPWVIGLRKDGSAFGILFDTTWQAVLDLRCGILFSTEAAVPDYPVYVVQGKSPQEIMLKLGEMTGTIEMPPRWALGYQQSKWSYYPDARAREIADTFRAKQIPCDVIWFDIHYMDGNRVFTFDDSRFPDPASTNAYMHSLGFKTVWMVNPGVKREQGNWVFDSGVEKDLWVKKTDGSWVTGWVHPGDCVFPDFSMPEVNSWWQDLFTNFLALGIDGVWNDMNEPFVGNGPDNTMPPDTPHRGGGEMPAATHQTYHNVYGMLMAQASWRASKNINPDKRPFVLTRSNFLGGHRYAATWTGDNVSSWEHFKWSIPMSISLGLCGQVFSGPDIGGFNFDATPELMAHWMAAGAFYPFSRAHACTNITHDQEPWEFGIEVENASRVALQRRYRLMPYLYTCFREAHLTGMPVMQPVFFADPADISLRMEGEAFLLGDSILVVPKWAEDVQLPNGIWETVSLVGEDSTSDKYQCDLRVKGGSIVPLGNVVQTTEQLGTIQDLTLLIVPDSNGKASGHVYEDAGDGYGFSRGQYCQSSFKAEKKGDRFIVRCSSQDGKLALDKRIVKVQIVYNSKVYYGLGDVCSEEGVAVVIK